MANVRIFDTTLRDGEQAPGCSMDLAEKIEIAQALERMKVDVIEAGFAIASQGDFESVQAIARTVKNCTVASLSRATHKDIDAAWNAVKGAKSPLIHTFLATSPTHMQSKLKMSEQEVLESIAAMVAYARNLCPQVEFSAEDAMRSDPAFLAKAVDAAIRAGAMVINIPDTVGYATPAEMAAMIGYLKQNVENIDSVTLSVHCHNDLGLAVANSLAAIRAGAGQVEGTINGIGERAGNAALEELVMAMGLVKGLRRLGRHVPEDLSIVGFDDLDLARMSDPSLTTVHQDIAEKGRCAVQMILDAADGNADKQECILPIRLIERESVAEHTEKEG